MTGCWNLSRARALILPLALVACERAQPAAPPPPVRVADCRDAEANVSVVGQWSLSGRGERTGCDDERANGAFEMRPMRRFVVTQSPDPEDPETDLLALTAPLKAERGTTTFAGRVAGSCVDFDLVHQDGGGEQGAMYFRGQFGGERVAGEFRGEGPSSCASTGTFEVEIAR